MELWHYLENQFEVCSRGNYKKAKVMESYQTAALIQQVIIYPVLAPLITRRDPLALAFRNDSTSWIGSGGTHDGQTLSMGQRMTLGTKQLNTMDFGIQLTPGWEKGTPAYKALFVDGHYPFTTGPLDTRIAAWDALQSNMGTIGALSTFKTQAIAIHANIDRKSTR